MCRKFGYLLRPPDYRKPIVEVEEDGGHAGEEQEQVGEGGVHLQGGGGAGDHLEQVVGPHVGASGRRDEGAAGGGEQDVHLGGGHVEEVAGAPEQQVQQQGRGEDGGGLDGEDVEE